MQHAFAFFEAGFALKAEPWLFQARRGGRRWDRAHRDWWSKSASAFLKPDLSVKPSSTPTFAQLWQRSWWRDLREDAWSQSLPLRPTFLSSSRAWHLTGAGQVRPCHRSDGTMLPSTAHRCWTEAPLTASGAN